ASRPPVRSWAATIASAVAHGVAVVVLVSLAKAASLTPLPRVNGPLTFFSIRIAPDPALIVPIEPVHLPPLVRDEPKTEELAPLDVAPPPASPKPPEVARAEPTPEPKREPPVVVEPP